MVEVEGKRCLSEQEINLIWDAYHRAQGTVSDCKCGNKEEVDKVFKQLYQALLKISKKSEYKCDKNPCDLSIKGKRKELDSPGIWEDEFMGYKKKTKKRS